MLTAWRIVKTRYAGAAFDGEGARLYGGRWSSAGVRVAYASQSVALATLEVLAGLGRVSLLPSYSLISAEFDESELEILPVSSLPAGWRAYAAPRALQVPSAIIDTEANYLLNPAHASFASVRIAAAAPFTLDTRLVAALRKT